MIKPCHLGLRRRGAVAVLVAISLTVLVMILAVTLDVGLLFAEKRHAQAVADAAALAGAADLYKNYAKNKGDDANGTAAASALANASTNGYANDGTASTIVVRTFGQAYLGGPQAGKPIDRGYIEISVTYNHPRYFSLILGSDTIPIKARAVATGTWDNPKIGLLVLDPTGTGLKLGGNGVVNVTTGVIQVNSSDPTSAIVNQNNGTITANELAVNGGISGAGAIITSPIPDNVTFGVAPAPDPLASLPVPTEPPAGSVTDINAKTQPGLDLLADLVSKGTLSQAIANSITNKIYVLTPGTYDAKTTILSNYGNGDLVIFKQASAGNGGIFYLKDAGFSSQGASLIMDPNTSGGMMFYNAGIGTSDKISISGNAAGLVNLSAVTSGTYQGVIVFQNRLATEPITITGNGAFNMLGTVYAPNGELTLTGNGSSQTIGSALIAKNVTLGGNGLVNINFGSGLVAPQRTFRLVE